MPAPHCTFLQRPSQRRAVYLMPSPGKASTATAASTSPAAATPPAGASPSAATDGAASCDGPGCGDAAPGSPSALVRSSVSSDASASSGAGSALDVGLLKGRQGHEVGAGAGSAGNESKPPLGQPAEPLRRRCGRLLVRFFLQPVFG